MQLTKIILTSLQSCNHSVSLPHVFAVIGVVVQVQDEIVSVLVKSYVLEESTETRWCAYSRLNSRLLTNLYDSHPEVVSLLSSFVTVHRFIFNHIVGRRKVVQQVPLDQRALPQPETNIMN